MTTGQFHNLNGEWVVKYDKVVHTPIGNHDYKVTLQEDHIKIHPEHKLWVMIFAQEGKQVQFEKQSIKQGDEDYVVAKFV
jgi:hypothetical protein